MIYLDYAATTPCAPEVIDAMLPYFTEHFANASSVDHVPGARVRKAVERAREQVASLIGAAPEEVIFTSGSTEANNLALTANVSVITSSIEHPSVGDALRSRHLQEDAVVSVDKDGQVVLDELVHLSTGRGPFLLSVIATNNELGTEQDIPRLVDVARSRESWLHLDATQAVATREISMVDQDVDACSISAHKINGPKGVGALVVRSKLRRHLRPVLFGGGHERGLRSGTLNVPGIVGFGVAAEVLRGTQRSRRETLTALRDSFLSELRQRLDGRVVSTVALDKTSPHICSLRFPGINNRALLHMVSDRLAFSLGSACATNKNAPSPVLLAIGIERAEANETIRCSFASPQPVADVLAAARIISAEVIRLGQMSISA